MSAHISGDGMTGMTLGQLRMFVDYTQALPDSTRLNGGVIGLRGHGLSIGYETLQGIETKS